jgi:hypothetical protein
MGKQVKVLPFVLLPILILLGFYLYTAENTAESSTEGPRQPILFSHKIHAGENQIACEYCHSYVAVSPWPGIPSLQKCMGCHSQVAGRDIEYEYNGKKINIKQEIQKVKDYWDKKTPIPWVRVHYLPDHVHFNHKRHILRGLECKTCHGEVEKMDVVHRVNKMEMGWCIGCHEQNAKDEEELTRLKDCLTCHC